MPLVRSNGIELETELIGSATGRPLVLISGLGSQLTRWHEDFCAGLAARGHRVLRFDNRDVGRSQHFDDFGQERIAAALRALRKREVARLAYQLDDMADDVIGLLDAHGWESAHIAGASMGGMIAQLVALRAPHRVRSLVSIMSTTNERDLPGPTPAALEVLRTPAPTERDAYVEQQVRNERVLHGDELPLDEATARRRAALDFERGIDPLGIARQYLAILAQPGRRAALGALRAPTLVIHGDRDPLVPLEAGFDTHRSIPASRWQVIRGMGHVLPACVWPELIDTIAQHTGRSEPA